MLLIGNKSYAYLGSAFRSEASYIPSRPTTSPSTSPTPDPGTRPNISNPPDTTNTRTILTYYTGISGNAFEDIKNMKSALAQNTGMPSTNGIKDDDEKGIPDIYVELLDANNHVVSTQRTDSNGNYSFSGLSSGNYKVRFRYGYLDDEYDMSQAGHVKNILAYNGEDYFCTSVGGSGNVLDSYTREIIISGKGCAQVFLTIDISPSMIEETYNGRPRISYQVEAARNLIESLLSNDDNTYIGIVVFSEKSLLLQNLTQNKDKLNQTLDTILDYANSGSAGGITNIKNALTLTSESFVNTSADSNRLIFLLSDGIPLTDGSGTPETTIYSEDLEPQNEETLRAKLMAIVDSTKAEMQRLVNDGIYMVSLITKTGDEEIDTMVQDMCAVENMNFFHVDDAEATNIITNYVKDLIMRNVTENLNEFSNYLTYLKGAENEARRNEVNNYFSTIDVAKSRLFKMIDGYTTSEVHQQLARELSNASYMIAETGSYTIENPSITSVEGGWNINGTFYSNEEYSVSTSSYSDQNLALASRDPFMLETDIKVSGVRITLSDGRNLFYDVDENSAFLDVDLANGETKTLRDAKEPVLLYYMDQEIMAGSTLEIEYTIAIKNPSPVSSSRVTVMSYIPEGLSFDKTSPLLTVPNQTNASVGWNVQSDLNIEDNPTNICVTANLEDNPAIRNASIGNNGERYIKVVFTKRLNRTNEISNFKGSAEIYGYSNIIGRRMQSSTSISATQVKLNSMYVANQNEDDFHLSSSVILIPPTGIGMTQQMIIYLLAITCIFITVVLFKNRKKHV